MKQYHNPNKVTIFFQTDKNNTKKPVEIQGSDRFFEH